MAKIYCFSDWFWVKNLLTYKNFFDVFHGFCETFFTFLLHLFFGEFLLFFNATIAVICNFYTICIPSFLHFALLFIKFCVFG